jgi:hypothetical protein
MIHAGNAVLGPWFTNDQCSKTIVRRTMDVGINNLIYMELHSGPKMANGTCGKTIVAGTIDRGSTVYIYIYIKQLHKFYSQGCSSHVYIYIHTYIHTYIYTHISIHIVRLWDPSSIQTVHIYFLFLYSTWWWSFRLKHVAENNKSNCSVLTGCIVILLIIKAGLLPLF